MRKKSIKFQIKVLSVSLAAVLLLLSACGSVTSVSPSGGSSCRHEWSDGVCRLCGAGCSHQWSGGVCTVCGMVCPHAEWSSGRCALCGFVCSHVLHSADTGECTVCGTICPHTYVDGYCSVCHRALWHRYADGTCADCGYSPLLIDGRGDSGYLSDYLILAEPVHAGTVETIEYETRNYMEEGSEPYTKSLQVYTPYDYDPSIPYNVLLLTHGLTDNEFTWLSSEHEYSYKFPYSITSAKTLLDNMYDWDYAEDVIVVSVTYYRDSSRPGDFEEAIDYPNFIQELRRDILPLIVSRYSTYAASSSIEDIIAARDHFGIAGLSMGAIVIYDSILRSASELFAWYGCFSGCGTDAASVASGIDSKADIGYPIRMFYNSIGSADDYVGLQEQCYTQVMESSVHLVEGTNAMLILDEGSAHDYHCWYNSLFNVLQIFFQ